MPVTSNNGSRPVADTWASRLFRKGPTSSDDAPTSAGSSTPSELASVSAGSTPRLAQGRKVQPRWSDVVDDCTDDDDIVDDVEESVAVGVEDSAAAPETSSRRRRRRGNRAKLVGGNGIKVWSEPQVMNNAINAGAGGKTDLRDRATATLEDLGLLISTPGKVALPNSPGTALMGQGGVLLGTAPQHVHYPCPVHAHTVAEASSQQHSFVGGIGYPYCAAQPALAPQPIPTMCAVVSHPGSHAAAVLPSYIPMNISHTPHENGFLVASPHHSVYGTLPFMP